MIRASTLFRAALVSAALVAASAPVPLSAETCISPYVKGLTTPEKVMYLWALPAKANGGPDYLAVIDVDLSSETYGKVLKRVKVGTSGNEAHHIGFTDDRTRIWAASLNSNRLFIFNVS